MILRRSTIHPPAPEGDAPAPEAAGAPDDDGASREESLLDLPLGAEKTVKRPSAGGTPEGAPAPPPAPLFEPELAPRPQAPRSTADRKPRPPKKQRLEKKTGPRPQRERPAPGKNVWPAALAALVVGAVGGFFANRHPAVAVLSEELVDFGEVRLQEPSAALSVELTNAGQRAMPVATVTVEGEGAEQFQVAGESCTGSEVTAEAGCAVEVLFKPAATGPQRAELVIRGEAANTARLPLVGVGIAPLLEVEPAALAFGRLTVGTRSRRSTLRFSNRGSATLAVAAVEVRGAGAADFVNHSDGCSGETLAPNERCELTYYFSPTKTGDRAAAVRLAGDGGDLGPAAELSGRGLPQEPELGLDPGRIDFTEIRVGTAGEPQRVTLKNEGTGPLTLKKLLIAADGGEEGEEGTDAAAAAEPPFALNAGRCASRQLGPGASCAVEVSFSPAGEGSARAFLEVHHTAGRGLHRVALVGAGVAPHVFLDPTRLDFSEVPLGASSNAQFLRLVNSGTGALTIAEIRPSGSDAGAFSARPVGCTTSPIAAKASCGVEVRFAPRRAGSHRAELLIVHDAEGEPDRVRLEGLGTAGRASVDHDRLNFGDVHVGRQARQELVVRNTGRARLAIERVSLSGRQTGDFSLPGDQCSGVRLEPGGSCTVAVRFTPSAEGARRAVVAIRHDADDKALEVPISARATPPPVPKIRLEPSRADLGELLVGERGEPFYVTVHNPGTGALVVRDFQIVGEDSLDFRIVPGTCEGAESVAAGTDCTIGLRFVPRAEGPRSSVLEIVHNAGTAPSRLALSGVGTVPPPAVPPGGGRNRK